MRHAAVPLCAYGAGIVRSSAGGNRIIDGTEPKPARGDNDDIDESASVESE